MDFLEFIYEILIRGSGGWTLMNGLWVTIEITILSLVLGTLIACMICTVRLCRNRFFRGLASFYIAVLRGSPVLLLLMLMSFVVFEKSNLPTSLIATMAFMLNVSAHVAELMRISITATDKMQAEAAKTLGLSEWQIARHITFPQAIKIAKPIYQSFIVNLIQWTSVVGYVNITDLMRVVNNISARTMQPVFMLIIGTSLYLALAYLCYGTFALLDKCATQRTMRSLGK